MRKTQMVSAVCRGLGMSMAFSLSAQAQDANANGDVSYLHNFPRDNVSLTLAGGAKQPLGMCKSAMSTTRASAWAWR